MGSTVNKIDRDLKPKRDHEFIVGIDRELGANFAVGLPTPGASQQLDLRPAAWPGLHGGALPRHLPHHRSPASYTGQRPATANGFTGDDLLARTRPWWPRAAAGASTRTVRGYHTDLQRHRVDPQQAPRQPVDGPRRRSRATTGSRTTTARRHAATRARTRATPPGTRASPGATAARWPSSPAAPARRASTAASSGRSTRTPSCSSPGASTCRARVFARQGGPYPISVRIAAGVTARCPLWPPATIDTNRYSDVWNVDLRLAKNIKLGGSANLYLERRAVQRLQQRPVLSRYAVRRTPARSPHTDRGAEPGLGRIEESSARASSASARASASRAERLTDRPSAPEPTRLRGRSAPDRGQGRPSPGLGPLCYPCPASEGGEASSGERALGDGDRCPGDRGGEARCPA